MAIKRLSSDDHVDGTLVNLGNVGIGTTSPGSALDVKGTLRLSGSTSGYVGLSPAAAAGSTTYTLPAADGSASQVLATNGSGVLSWVVNGSGSPATLAATNAWTGVNSFAAQTTTSRLMGNNYGASGYPFDLTQNGTVALAEAIGAGNIASTMVNTSTNVFPTSNTFAYINTYGTKATGIGFHAGTATEILRVSSSLPMTGYTKWQNVNAVVVGYLNNGPRVVIQDYDLSTQQSNTIRLTADNIVIGETQNSVDGLGRGGIAYAGIKTIADVSTTLDHTAAYILLGGTGAYTITLPSAATDQGVANGRWYLFKKITATNVVTIAAASGQTIDGAASVTISTQWSTLRVLANGAPGTGLWYTV